MAGFFDRIKENFTKFAAGTDDLSALTPEQQKLLRRQAMGRLGASLYQNGDFGAGMEAQAKAAAEQRAQMQAEAMQRQRQSVFGNIMGGGEQASPQSPLTPEQQAIVATPRLLASPETRSQQAGIAAQQAQAPQPAAAQGGIPADLRDRLKRGVLELQAIGDLDGAKQLLDYAKQFAPLETWFAPTEYTDRETGETRLSQFSNLGSRQLTDTLAAEPDSAQIVRIGMRDPAFRAARLEDRAAGATNVSVTNSPGNYGLREIAKMDAGRLNAMQTALGDSARALPGLQAAYEALSRNDTGALAAAILPIQRFINPGAPEVADASVAASGIITSVLAKLKGVGGNDTEKEMQRILDTEPNWANNPEANRRLFALAIRGLQELQQDVTSAENVFYDQGSLRGWRPTAFSGLNTFQQDVAGAQPGAQPTSRYANIPGFRP